MSNTIPPMITGLGPASPALNGFCAEKRTGLSKRKKKGELGWGLSGMAGWRLLKVRPYQAKDGRRPRVEMATYVLHPPTGTRGGVLRHGDRPDGVEMKFRPKLRLGAAATKCEWGMAWTTYL